MLYFDSLCLFVSENDFICSEHTDLFFCHPYYNVYLFIKKCVQLLFRLFMRPGTSKRPPTSQQLPIGTATRLTTGLRQRLTTAAAATSSALNTELTIEDRPITAQGLKTAPKGPQRWRRQVEDRAYFIGVLRSQINMITAELTTIAAQHETAEKEAQSYMQYEKMAEALAVELRSLQVALSMVFPCLFEIKNF